MGIGVPELLAPHNAVLKKADNENLAIGTAAYRVMEDIDGYNKLGDLKKQLYDVAMQIHMMNQISARQNQVIMALLKLQARDLRDDEIVNVYEFLNMARFESAGTIRR